MTGKTFFISIIFAYFFTINLGAQTYFTKDGVISFYSSTPIEEIEAVNEKAVSIFDFDASRVEFSVLIKGFHFKNALMQTHFNENYMDSDHFPKANFKSTDFDVSSIDLKKDGQVTIPVKGILNIRGIEKEILTDVLFDISGGKFSTNCNFIVSPEDFNIEIPALVRGKIAEEIQVKVTADYQLYTKS